MAELIDHAVAKKLLLEVTTVLDELRIPFFLMQGTALGAFRDKGFTPTETDIDLGFLQEDLTSNAPTIFDALTAKGYEVHSFILPFTRVRSMKLMKHEINIDLVGFMKWEKVRFTHNCDRKTKPYAIVHQAPLLETYQTVELFGRKFQIPYPIEVYLEREYGEDWRTPKADSVSRTRMYDFMEDMKIPSTLLETK